MCFQVSLGNVHKWCLIFWRLKKHQNPIETANAQDKNPCKGYWCVLKYFSYKMFPSPSEKNLSFRHFLAKNGLRSRIIHKTFLLFEVVSIEGVQGLHFGLVVKLCLENLTILYQDLLCVWSSIRSTNVEFCPYAFLE